LLKETKTEKIFSIFFITIDFLSEDILTLIAKKVVSHSARDLFHFMRTNKRHANICKSREVSRAFGDDCTELLTNLLMTHAKLNFIDHLLNVGNPLFCILQSTQHIFHLKPRLDEIDCLLRNAINAGSWAAKYYHLLMTVTSTDSFDLEQVLNDFWVLLTSHSLRRYWMDIKRIGTSFMFRSTWYKRHLPPGIRYMCFCPCPHRCMGDGRRAGLQGQLPGDDVEYVLNNFCIRCRLDGQVRWFMDVFSFANGLLF